MRAQDQAADRLLAFQAALELLLGADAHDTPLLFKVG